MLDELAGPDVIGWLGVRYKTILPASETHGAMSIVDSLSPAGSGPPRHVHEREDEPFILLSGECEFWLEGGPSPQDQARRRSCRAGASTPFVLWAHSRAVIC